MSSTGGGAAVSKRKKRALAPPPLPLPPSSSSSSVSSSSAVPYPSTLRGLRMPCRRRNPRISAGSGLRGGVDVDALALPLGMSIAAVVSQVSLNKESAEEQMSADYLSMLCTSAIRESLTNIYGDKVGSFVGNFEKSFQSTLKTLRLINESSKHAGRDHSLLLERSHSDSSSVVDNSEPEEVFLPTNGTNDQLSMVERISENAQTDSMNLELTLHQRMDHSSAVSSSSLVEPSVLSTFEKSLIQQTRYNDLKAYELSLQVKKLQLKETQLALHTHSNFLERFKLSLGISKAYFRAEKFKSQLEETRYAELLKNCLDCLVAALIIMLVALAYGTYIHSYRRINEITASCNSPKDSAAKSWWIPRPVSSFNSGLHILRCQLLVASRMLFGVLMILSMAFLLLQRSVAMKQVMPITLILLLLGGACGFAGKLCVDTLGGDGFQWLLYWEALCLLHFFSNVWTGVLFFVLYGPITAPEERAKRGWLLPYRLRRYLFYVVVLLLLPLCCGLLPFAGIGEWKEHFVLQVGRFFSEGAVD